MRFVVVVGLPCGGKSTYVNATFAQTHEIYDDFLDQPFLLMELKSRYMTEPELKVCLNDPRLCSPKTWRRFAMQVSSFVDKSDLGLVLFRNQPEICLANSRNVERDVRNNILDLSREYDLEQYGGVAQHNIVLDCYRAGPGTGQN